MTNKQKSAKSFKKGRKPYDRSKRYSDAQRVASDEQSAAELTRNMTDNDERWYAQNPQLLQDYANFPYGQGTGLPVRMNVQATDSSDYAVPGIMTFEIVPSIGWATNEVDPINIAMREAFNRMRKANSGRTNYEAPNLMMYIIAVAQARSYLAFMQRIYGIMRTYNPLNYYLPKALVTAMHVDFESIQDNVNDFRGYINQFAARLNQMVIPAGYSYVRRQAWMYENVYMDSNATKAQLYMYTPAGFFVYQEGTAEEASWQLNYTPIVDPSIAGGDQALMTFEDLINYGTAMLNPILGSQDFNVMAGDILKAFDLQGVEKTSMIDESYQVLPVFNAEVLSQMENCSPVGYPINAAKYPSLTDYHYTIKEDKTIGGGFLVSTPWVRMPAPFNSYKATVGDKAVNIMQPTFGDRLLNFHHDHPTPGNAMVATRLMAIPDSAQLVMPKGTGDYYAPLTTVASEWVAATRIYFYKFTNGASQLVNVGPLYYTTPELLNNNFSIDTSPDGTSVFDAQSSQLYARQMLPTFDWHHAIFFPRIFATNGKLTGSGPDFPPGGLTVSGYAVIEAVFPEFDVDNYTILTAQNLQQLATAALLSEFTIR